MGRPSTAAQPQKRGADTKLAQSRLSVLELAKELGNVAEACRRRGLDRTGPDRTSFYEWKRRFQTQGFEGLKDLPPIHKSHPQTTPEPVVQRIRELALAQPAHGCNRHEAMLALEGIRLSAIAKDWDRTIASATAWTFRASIRMLTRRIARLSIVS